MFTNDENDKKIFVNFRLILFIALSLAVGIAFSYFLLIEKIVLAVGFCVVFVVLCVWYFAFNIKRSVIVLKLIFCAVFAIFFLIGAISFNRQITDYNNAELGNGYYNVTATVSKTETIENGVVLQLKNVRLKGDKSTDYNVELRVYGEETYELGDEINFYAKLNDKELIYEDRFLSNDVVDKIKYTAVAYSENVRVIKSSPDMFQKVNIVIRNTLKSGMSQKSFTIAYALLTGASENMDDDVISVFRNTGVAHIFAVSGLHIGFLAFVLNFVFKKIPINAYLKAVIISFILFFYSGVCGFSASSVRACIMSVVTLLVTIGGLRYDGLTSVSIAGIIILLLSPSQLFCVGFQLSFTVVIGILSVSPALTRLFRFLPDKLASSLATVISAQLFGIPILLYAFSRFSVVSIIVNLLFIPVVGVVYVGLLLLTVIGAMFSIPTVTLFIPDLVIKVLTVLIEFFDEEFFIIGGFSLGAFATLYYVSVLIASGFFNIKRLTATLLSVALVVACGLGTVLKTVRKEEARVIVSGSDDFCFTVISEQDKGVLVISDISQTFSVSRLNRIKTSGQVKEMQAVVITNLPDVKDLPLVIVKILNVYSSPYVYYYGEKDATTESIVNHSFPSVGLCNYLDSQSIQTENFTLTARLNGYVITTDFYGKSIAVFSKLDKTDAEYHGLNAKFDLLIAVNYTDVLTAMYGSKETISYIYHNDYPNAESRGNLKYYL